MKYFELGKTGLQVSNLAMGCMRIDGKSKEEVARLIETAMEEGINFFDHADIYGGDHACERYFAESLALTNVKREDMIVQTKCGIRPFGYDFSRDHILKQVDDSLRCLNMDYLDVLLLHRPDALMEPDEVAEAFDRLHSAGKVRFFGVSNHNPMQIRLLEKSLHQKLQVNQLQMGIAHTPMIDSGMAVNMAIDQSINRDGSVLLLPDKRHHHPGVVAVSERVLRRRGFKRQRKIRGFERRDRSSRGKIRCDADRHRHCVFNPPSGKYSGDCWHDKHRPYARELCRRIPAAYA